MSRAMSVDGMVHYEAMEMLIPMECISCECRIFVTYIDICLGEQSSVYRLVETRLFPLFPGGDRRLSPIRGRRRSETVLTFPESPWRYYKPFGKKTMVPGVS